MRRRNVVVAVCAALICAACSTTLPVSREAMIPGRVEAERQHPYSVRVVASGGADAIVFGSPFVISDADLKSAVEVAISGSRVFRSVVQGGDADFELAVKVATVSKSLHGTDLELEMGWSLVRTTDRKSVWRASVVTASSTRNRPESGPAMKGALAEAARENIAQALKKISGQSL